MGFFDKFKNFGRGDEKTPSPSDFMEDGLPPVPDDAAIPISPELPPMDEIVEAPPPEPEKPAIMELGWTRFGLEELLKTLVEKGGSDLHLEVGSHPVFRIKGDMLFSDLPVLTQEFMEMMILPLVDPAKKHIFDETGNLDFAHQVEGLARFRVNILKQYYGMGSVFRVIPEKIPTIEQLSLPDVLKSLCNMKRGIVVVTGPTGSGKSTTMAAMINYINNTRKGHIITIEDPIEFTHTSQTCLVDHREVGTHALSFAEALKAALREDPNIILVGEMRDLETIALAITAAEMGVLVFGTLHTNSAAKTVDRIIDVFPAKQQEQIRSQLSQSLRGVIAQQLLKTADGKGRCAAIEVMVCNMGIASLIREGKTTHLASFIQMGKNEGMQTMDNTLLELWKANKISREAAIEKAHDATALRKGGIVV